jgi:hypothetical protein
MKYPAALLRLLFFLGLALILPCAAFGAGCLTSGCHQELTAIKHMHGPLGAELAGAQGCIMCHTPAGPACTAAMAGTFIIKTKDLCRACHIQGAGSQHANAATPCLDCHDPHGSNHSPYMLRPRS